MDDEGSPLAVRYRAHRQITPQPGWVEHDPEEIWRNVELTMAAALKAAHVQPSDLAGIGIANQGETVMAWDSVSGRPLANAIVWQCDRTRNTIERLKRKAGVARRIHRISGLVPDCYFSATKMRWLYDNVAECRKLAREKRLRIGTLDTWLIWKLSGGSRFVTDATTASRTLLMDLRKLKWSTELLEVFRARNLRIKPAVVGDIVAVAAAGTGLEQRRQVAMAYPQLVEVRYKLRCPFQVEVTIQLQAVSRPRNP